MKKDDSRIRIYLSKEGIFWREHRIKKEVKTIKYIASSDRKNKVITIVSSNYANVAHLEFHMKTILGCFVDPVKVVIHVFEPDFSFEINLSELGILYNVEDFSVICPRPSHINVVDGEVQAIDVGPCAGSVEAYCADEKYEFLAVALMIALQAYRNRSF